MKKSIFLFAAAAFAISCGNNNTKPATSETATATTEAMKPASTGMTAEQEKGLDLITKSDCLTCHKLNETNIGPAYTEVAKRYAGKSGIEDSLAQKIIKGGAGNWGQVPMTPHPQISEADAKTMVQYVLSVNNQ